jgi:cysteine desulfurase/selenocysteine lyase
MTLADNKGIVVKYIELEEDNSLSINKVKEAISDKTKVISIAHITNSIGDVRPVEEIGKLCKDNNILFVLDATQSVGHMKLDVQKLNVDFLAFSGHKMLGPTGVGVLYGKEELLEKLVPLEYGGGMNEIFSSDGKYELKELPYRLEAGTSNIAGVIGLGKAIDYLLEIGLDNIHKYEIELKKYLIDKIKKVPNIKIYNESFDSGVLLFNVGDYFSQDVAIYLDQFKICIRAGNHCAKMLQEVINKTNTCRVSLYFYNTKEEVDKFIEALSNQDKILDNIV